MKKFCSIISLLILISMAAIAKGYKMPMYDITGAGSGTEGTVLVKVFVYAKVVDDNELIRAAVHGVVFRGFEGNNSGARQPAMAPQTAEKENAAFCEKFFAKDGDCLKYASVVEGSYDRAKTANGYKCGAILQVDKKTLRKDLEQAGVVRSLSSGF